MTIFEVPFWKKWGMGGVAEWQVNTVIVSVLIRKFTRRRAAFSLSVAMHLFHGAALGIFFRALLIVFRVNVLIPSVLVYAILYSTVLWIIFPYLTRKIFESA